MSPARKLMPPALLVRERLNYDPSDGSFKWNVGYGKPGPAGRVDAKGYLTIGIERVEYKAHRLAWLYMTGEEPPDFIDHANGNTMDNRWANLRAATSAQNVANSRIRNRHSSGLKGVYRASKGDCWAARIIKDGRSNHLGCFPTPELAHDAYMSAARNLHGEFANGGSMQSENAVSKSGGAA